MKNNRKVYRDYWWQYAEKRPAMLEATSGLDRVLGIALTSRTQIPVLIDGGQVFDQTIVVFPTSSFAVLALRASNVQYTWTRKFSSSMKGDIRFVPSDCCETLPMPPITANLDHVGATLDSFQREAFRRRRVGLTALYNLVHNEAVQDEDIMGLREIHVEINEAVREAYALDEEREPGIREFEAKIASAPLPSWREIDLGHGFHETRQGVRFTISPEAQLDVLDKLLALNHYRYRQEQEKGVTRKKRRRTSAKPARQAGEETSLSIENALSPRDDTLF